MFCPKCKAEYREGFYRCADCDIDLVYELPDEPEPEYVSYKELLYTYSPGDIAFIKSLLDAGSIKYYIKGEHFLQIRPLAQAAGIMVDEKQYEEARELLKDFKGRFTGLGADEDRF